ncbi:hypothetical protein PINS_up018351 [Pythium insidiosum]|nr:hypothetical protein PINS_up018351 [Pythium insidiosum]
MCRGDFHVLVVLPPKRVGYGIMPTPNVAELMQCAAQLKDAAVGSILNVPTLLLDAMIHDGLLFIRQEYEGIFQLIMNDWKSPRPSRYVAVLGSPGVGKSVFRVYIFLRLMSERHNLAHYSTRYSQFVYFTFDSESEVYKVLHFPPRSENFVGLFDDGVWVKALKVDYQQRSSHSVLFSLPGTSQRDSESFINCSKVILNPWSKAECQDFFDKTNLAGRDNWVAFYNLVGGIPRYVVAQSEELSTLVMSVQNALPDSIQEMKAQIATLKGQFINDRRLHYLYSFYRVPRGWAAFPSTAVEALLRSRFENYSAAKLSSHLGVGADEMSLWQTIEPEKFQLQTLATKPFVVKALCTLDDGKVIQYGERTQYEPLGAPIKTFTVLSDIRDELALYLSLSATSGQIDGVLVVPQLARVLYITTTVSRLLGSNRLETNALYQHLRKRKEFRQYNHIQLIAVPENTADDVLVFTDGQSKRGVVTYKTTAR